MLRRIAFLVLSGAVATSVAACGDDASDDADAEVADGSKDPAAEVTGGKADAWNYQNDPERFGGELNRTLAELPEEGRAAEGGWPSTYWPTYQDSVNVRWNQEFSPAEKYDRAFNGWTPPENFDELRPFDSSNCDAESWDTEYYDNLGPLAQHVSANMGNLRSRDGVDSDGDGQIDECDDHDGVETWWGLCHAWVPASIHELRPQRSVTYNGVTFHTADLEALLILAYNRSGATMIGSRCNLFSTPEEMAAAKGCRLPDQEPRSENDARAVCSDEDLERYVISRDEHGRAEQDQCRDTNAGSMHVILSNYLGLMQRSFAYDRTFDYQVWNQPIVAFDVSKLEEVSAEQAMGLLGAQGDTYTYNDEAVKLYEVHSSVTYITESHASTVPADQSRYERQDRYKYILEVDGEGQIIGGEFFGDARSDHPDFLWDPARRDTSSVPHMDLETVRMLVDMSRQPAGSDVDALVASGQGGLDIPDDSPAGVSSVASLQTDASVAGVQVELAIAHTYVGDLRVVLAHEGVERVIHDRTGGGDDDLRRTFTVTGFDGLAAAGDWTLTVSDHAGQDVGKLESWDLRVIPGEPVGDGPSTDDTVLTAEGTGGAIPDNDETGFSNTVTVEGAGSVTGLVLDLELRHTYIGDLTVELSHGDRTHVVHNRDGGDLDDIVKEAPISAFNGMDAAGEWTLRVIDGADRDEGNVVAWSLRIDTGEAGPLEGDGDETLTFAGDADVAVPDNDEAGVTVEAGVPAGTTGTVSIAATIRHSYRGDLRVVASFGEQEWVLHDKDGGNADDLVQTWRLDPQPQGDLGGTWKLTVFDTARLDTGSLESWSVVVIP